MKDENSIVIKNIDVFVTESMLFTKFIEVGEIKLISLKIGKQTGKSQGTATIEYKNESSVKEAVRRFHMKKFFDSNSSKEQNYMEVVPKLPKDKLNELKQSCQLYFKLSF